jgi:hypothetical protein
MTITPIEDVAFDDATTLAMGEAFDNACKTLQNFVVCLACDYRGFDHCSRQKLASAIPAASMSKY